MDNVSGPSPNPKGEATDIETKEQTELTEVLEMSGVKIIRNEQTPGKAKLNFSSAQPWDLVKNIREWLPSFTTEKVRDLANTMEKRGQDAVIHSILQDSGLEPKNMPIFRQDDSSTLILSVLEGTTFEQCRTATSLLKDAVTNGVLTGDRAAKANAIVDTINTQRLSQEGAQGQGPFGNEPPPAPAAPEKPKTVPPPLPAQEAAPAPQLRKEDNMSQKPPALPPPPPSMSAIGKMVEAPKIPKFDLPQAPAPKPKSGPHSEVTKPVVSVPPSAKEATGSQPSTTPLPGPGRITAEQRDRFFASQTSQNAGEKAAPPATDLLIPVHQTETPALAAPAPKPMPDVTKGLEDQLRVAKEEAASAKARQKEAKLAADNCQKEKANLMKDLDAAKKAPEKTSAKALVMVILFGIACVAILGVMQWYKTHRSPVVLTDSTKVLTKPVRLDMNQKLLDRISKDKDGQGAGTVACWKLQNGWGMHSTNGKPVVDCSGSTPGKVTYDVASSCYNVTSCKVFLPAGMDARPFLADMPHPH